LVVGNNYKENVSMFHKEERRIDGVKTMEDGLKNLNVWFELFFFFVVTY
jgi:hypothetical protein